MEFSKLTEAVVAFDENKIYRFVDEYLDQGMLANHILKAFRNGMSTLGDMYKREEIFVSDMMFAGEIMRNVMKKLKPILVNEGGPKEVFGKVIIGTVKGDIHDLGKDLVIMILRGNGFEVVDLGVDVPYEKVVEAIKSNPDSRILGLSVLLTSVFQATTMTVEAIKGAGLRDKVKIMVGGGPVTLKVAKETGCDFFGEDAVTGLNYVREVYGVP